MWFVRAELEDRTSFKLRMLNETSCYKVSSFMISSLRPLNTTKMILMYLTDYSLLRSSSISYLNCIASEEELAEKSKDGVKVWKSPISTRRRSFKMSSLLTMVFKSYYFIS